jgi:hypothetical protein
MNPLMMLKGQVGEATIRKAICELPLSKTTTKASFDDIVVATTCRINNKQHLSTYQHIVFVIIMKYYQWWIVIFEGSRELVCHGHGPLQGHTFSNRCFLNKNDHNFMSFWPISRILREEVLD